jgi:uncharacterized membrane protein YagU involved in acid resistance
VQTLPTDIAVGLLAGLVATRVTDLAQGPLRRMTPASVARRERRVSPGGASSSQVAAKRVAEHLGHAPGQQRVASLGRAVHLGVGMAWGPVYGLLRRHGGLGPIGAGLATGVAMSLVLDEGVVPALGLSAANQDYPILTHVRGLLAHLVYGAAAALAAEGLGRLVGRLPAAPRRHGSLSWSRSAQHLSEQGRSAGPFSSNYLAPRASS